jgi:hypothetical protein
MGGFHSEEGSEAMSSRSRRRFWFRRFRRDRTRGQIAVRVATVVVAVVCLAFALYVVTHGPGQG